DADFPATFPGKGAVKPIMVAEYGTQEQADGGIDKGNWFRNAHETVMERTAATPAACGHCGAYSDIAAMVYFDVSGKSADDEGGWDIETTEPSLAGYMEYSDHPWFNQIQTLTWGPYTGSTPAPAPGPDPTPTPTPTPTPDPGTPANPPVAGRSGYWMLGADGKVYSFGDAKAHGDAPVGGGSAIGLVAVDVEPTPSGNGYWIVDSTGRVFTQGDAEGFGSVSSPLAFGETVTSLSSTVSGKGYWIFTSRGRVLNFGDAAHLGDVSAVKLNGPVLDSIPTPSGRGYYMVASDGGIFSFGDAGFYGSTGGMVLNQPIVGMVPTRVVRSNDFPTAVPDSVTLDEDNSVTVNVLANDSGLTDAPITVSLVDGPSHGGATVGAGGRIIYTPAANYFGPDSLTYAVTDADGDRSLTTVSIAVSSRNDAPVAADQALFTPEETTINGFLAASDADGDAITYAVTTAPAHGTATVTAVGFFTYTPAVDYNGNDTFVITASDGRGGTDTVKIGI
ncbi:MAG: cadherin-like domain-containing protein, partial [Micromonosporaceae bacterium]